MIREWNLKYWIKRYCNEDPSLIENYEQAINDNENIWDLHHKLEIELNKSRKELKEMGLYEKRPANELIFLKHSEHMSLHNKNILKTEEHKLHMRKPHKNYKKRMWLTPTGEIKEMCKSPVTRCHPDWVLLDESFNQIPEIKRSIQSNSLF